MAENKKISQLNPAVAFTGAEKFELLQGGLNLYGTPEQMKNYIGGITREFNRAFSSELLFDKNMIEGELHTQTDDITFTVAEAGNLVDQESIFGQRIVTDGVHPIYFSNFNHLANIASGDILEAGTYQFIFWYSNGLIRGSVMLPREETVMLTPLSIPTNFDAVPGTDPETEVDLSWDAVANASSYHIDFSTAGGAGPWTSLTDPGSGDTTYTHTGRSPNTTYHYRIRAIGVAPFANSGYAVDATTTNDAGDVTAPTFISSPIDTASDIPVNQVVIITADEPLIDADGVTEITNANILDYLTAVNSSAVAQLITATIDATKKIITITPDVVFTELDDITITLDGVEDLNGNEPSAFAITFTTSDYTEMAGNRLNFSNQIASVITGDDINFEIEFEFKNPVLVGDRTLTAQWQSSGLQVSHVWKTSGNDVKFKFYFRESPIGFSAREITWTDALLGITEGKLKIKYFGAIDTNNGLDRVELYLDDVLISAGKSLFAEDGTSVWPWMLRNTTAPFLFTGLSFAEVRNFKVRNNMGATTVLDVPIIRTGEDVSGNNFDGTWT